MNWFYLLLWLVLAHSRASSQVSPDTPTCLDEQGKPVDWYIVYKNPQIGKEEPFSTGYAYVYITSKDVRRGSRFSRINRSTSSDDLDDSFLNRFKNLTLEIKPNSSVVREPISWTIPVGSSISRNSTTRTGTNRGAARSRQKNDDKLRWTISSRLLTEPDSMVQRTLKIAYDKRSKESNRLNAILYNDAPPENPDGKNIKSNSRAHAKGAILIDDESGDGLWLIHSTPHYPPFLTEELKFSASSEKNGQTFMCLNFDAKRTGSQIVDHLITMFPLIYDSRISEKLQAMIPNLKNLTFEDEKKRVGKTYEKKAQVIKTRRGQDLYLYSKSSEFGDDLYAGWLTQEIKSPMYVESWRIASGTPLNSSCPQNEYHVNNVESIQVAEGTSTISWSYSKDHSKWAISDEVNPGVACITDINRNKSQFLRGGGAVCVKSLPVWDVFYKAIQDLEPCPRGAGRRLNKLKQ